MDQDYRMNPVAGRQYAGESQMAKKKGPLSYERGQLVMIKRPKLDHFALGAQGPYIVL